MAKLPFSLAQKMRKRIPSQTFSGFVTKPLPLSYRISVVWNGAKQLAPYVVGSFSLAFVWINFLIDLFNK
jgi:hypothetical protein